ncbi:MAG: hypothetical protein ABR526_11060, partial [Chthoniobacterales bacterium]
MPDDISNPHGDAAAQQTETRPPSAAQNLTPAAELEALKPFGGQTGGDDAPDPLRPALEHLTDKHNGLTSVVGIGASA